MSAAAKQAAYTAHERLTSAIQRLGTQVRAANNAARRLGVNPATVGIPCGIVEEILDMDLAEALKQTEYVRDVL